MALISLVHLTVRIRIRTQRVHISNDAIAKQTMLARNGVVLDAEYCTRESPKTPAKIATTLLKVVILPKMSPRPSPALSNPRLWYSVIIQVSKTLNSNVVESPPRALPTRSTKKSLESIVKQQREYARQYARHAARLPYLSASEPTKDALIAPAMKPTAYSAATVVSGNPFSYLYRA
jgi:hypothetical protein